MKLRFSVLAFSVCLLSAQTPNLSGVWKANPEKSKFAGGQAPSDYILVIEQTDSRINGKTRAMTQHGEQRSSFSYNTARPGINMFMGTPMRAKASWEGSTLSVDEHVGGAHPADVHEKYVLGADGNSLTVETTISRGGHDVAQTVVYDKQPESAGDVLKKPEETAGAHFKNVTILKDMPASQLIDTMRYFTFALGEECEFCHVKGNFASDENKTKGMARMMLTMTQNINTTNFNGRMEVRCFTCHQGHHEPLRLPE